MHTVCIAYRVHCIPCALHIVCIAYRVYCIPCVSHTVCIAYRHGITVHCIRHVFLRKTVSWKHRNNHLRDERPDRIEIRGCSNSHKMEESHRDLNEMGRSQIRQTITPCIITQRGSKWAANICCPEVINILLLGLQVAARCKHPT